MDIPLTVCMVVSLLLALYISDSAAVEWVDVEMTCPVGGEVFVAKLVAKQARAGLQLDFKPYGDVVSPVPLGVCPSNGTVIYQPEFTTAEVGQLTALVETDTYQRLRDQHTTYYLLARTFEHMQRHPLQTAFMYLQATWEVETEPDRYAAYSAQALSAFDTYVDQADPRKREYVSAHLLQVELYRRRGEFESAKATLDLINAHEEAFKPYASRIIILLYELIAKRDTNPHAMP